jgi:putative endonuclease
MYSGPIVYYVYIMSNRSKTLYTGVTSKLENRVFEHKHHTHPGFTSRYRVDRLVYFERFGRRSCRDCAGETG